MTHATQDATAVTCLSCSREKPVDEFYFDKARGGVYPYCKVCQRAKSLARYHLTKVPGQDRNPRLKFRYGITEAQYDAKYDDQNGRCAICHEPKARGGKKGLHVDHDHTTGQVRSLLCNRCNLMVGYFESPLAGAAVAYLEGHGGG